MMNPIQEDFPVNGNFMEVNNTEVVKTQEGVTDVDEYKHRVENVVVKVDELEQKVNDLAQFYSSLSKKLQNNARGGSAAKEKGKERQVPSIKRQQQEATKREVASGKRMQELIRQFGTIFRQITSHKWAYPFDEPVDVEALGLDDYFEVIDTPMDFKTIKNRMDENYYKNIREICSDVRLVFKNAMTYNDEKDDVHIMAKTLLAKFEDKWLLLLPKVIEEENRRKEEETELRLSMQLAQEAANAQTARHLSHDLSELEGNLDQLREQVLQKCRKVSCKEKKWINEAAGGLTLEDLGKTVEIIAQDNPNIDATAEEFDADLETLSEITLWKLIFFMKGAFQAYKAKAAAKEMEIDNNNKRKQDICDALALAKTTTKKRKKTM
ncbi:Transcription factor GTE1 [Ranunculus cassubicifolius]